MTVQSLGELSVALQKDQNLIAEFKTDPGNAIQKIALQAQVPDTWVYRLVIIGLALTTLLVVVACFILEAISQMPQQDYAAAKIKHSKKVFSVSFVADN